MDRQVCIAVWLLLQDTRRRKTQNINQTTLDGAAAAFWFFADSCFLSTAFENSPGQTDVIVTWLRLCVCSVPPFFFIIIIHIRLFNGTLPPTIICSRYSCLTCDASPSSERSVVCAVITAHFSIIRPFQKQHGQHSKWLFLNTPIDSRRQMRGYFRRNKTVRSCNRREFERCSFIPTSV